MARRSSPKLRPSAALALHRTEIREVILANRLLNPRIFGSVLHGEDVLGSDLDILVDRCPDASLFDRAEAQRLLEECLGVEVHITVASTVPSEYRASIVDAAQPV
jgi:predicted nucleotidyltransferase